MSSASNTWSNSPRCSARSRRIAPLPSRPAVGATIGLIRTLSDSNFRQVRLCHSSWEADEQSGLDRRGAGGAKGRGQGECEPAKHAPDSEPGKCVTGAGAHTANRNDKTLCRHTPKVGEAMGRGGGGCGTFIVHTN